MRAWKTGIHTRCGRLIGVEVVQLHDGQIAGRFHRGAVVDADVISKGRWNGESQERDEPQQVRDLGFSPRAAPRLIAPPAWRRQL